jgi:hypothetical protein
MHDDDLFDNGIDGEPFAENDAQIDADYEAESEGYRVFKENGLEVTAWSTYGNYTIITDTFHMYWWPSANKLEVYDLRLSTSKQHVLTLPNVDLSFFGEEKLPDEDGKVDIDFYAGEQVNRKVQRYLNLKAFL